MLPGIWGGYVVMWMWFGPRIRSEASEQKYLTPTEFLTANVDGQAKARIAGLAALLVAFCFIFYIAAQFAGAAQAFITNFDMTMAGSILLSAGIVLIYCLLGGFWAASVTDTLQGVVMMLAAILVPTMAVVAAGGPLAILNFLESTPSDFTDWTGGHSGFVLIGFLLGMSGLGLGTFGQPHLLARLMAVKGERERKQGFLIAITWAVLVYVGMSWLALAARAMALTPASGEQIFYLLAGQLLPPVLAGIVVAAILSAVMSTVDSLLLAAAATVSHDLGLASRFQVSELWLSRVVMIAIVVAAVVLALVLPDTIFNRVLFAWNALGAAFGPLIIARILGKEPAATARFWSIVAGFGLTVLFYLYGTIDVAETSNFVSEWLAIAARYPGDPFERFVPFLPPLCIVFFWPRSDLGDAQSR